MTNRSKRWFGWGLAFVVFTIVGLVSLLEWASLPPDPFRAIQVGNSRAEVEQLLGKPTGFTRPWSKEGRYETLLYLKILDVTDQASTRDTLGQAHSIDYVCLWTDNNGIALVRFDSQDMVVAKGYCRQSKFWFAEAKKFLGL